MMVRGYEYIDLAVLVFGKGFYWNCIERNDEMIADMRKAAIEFWNNNVLTMIPPEPDGSESSLRVLKELYPTGMESKEVYLEGLEYLLDSRQDYKESIKRMESAVDEIDAKLIATMGDAAVGKNERWQVTYKNQERTSVDSKALKEKYPEIYNQVSKTSSFRVLRTKKL